MLQNDIRMLQSELNSLINTDSDYDRILEASIRLDRLIVEYYREINAPVAGI